MNEKLGNECVAEEIRISGSLLRGCRVGFEAGGTGPPFVGRPVVETAPVAIFGGPPGIRVGQIEAGRRMSGAPSPAYGNQGHLMMIEKVIEIQNTFHPCGAANDTGWQPR